MAVGTGHTLAVDASSLASGLYVYRLVARGATGIMTETGRMTLLK